MSIQLGGGFAPPPSSLIPIADNDIDAQLRVGLAGTTGEFADAGHNHPIRRQTIPATPVITPFGTGFTIVGTTINGSTSDEESVTFFITLQVTQTISNAWNGFTIANIAGFQRAEVTPTACYRYTGNLTGFPIAPTMSLEWSYYFNGTAYMNVPNRTVATGYYISFKVKYIRT